MERIRKAGDLLAGRTQQGQQVPGERSDLEKKMLRAQAGKVWPHWTLNAAGFSPTLQELDSKKEAILQKWELKESLGTNKGADLKIWELAGGLVAGSQVWSVASCTLRVYTIHHGNPSFCVETTEVRQVD